MLTPRYYFTGEFCRFYDYFLSHPHTERRIPVASGGSRTKKIPLHKKRRADALR
mgnify:CR=1 FL=1